jgi:hypothetical protein
VSGSEEPPAHLRPVTVEISRFWPPEVALAVFELIDDLRDKILAVVLPHSGMLPSGPGIASPECSRSRARMSIGFRYESGRFLGYGRHFERNGIKTLRWARATGSRAEAGSAGARSAALEAGAIAQHHHGAERRPRRESSSAGDPESIIRHGASSSGRWT